jgi:chaperonin GroES
MLTLPPGSTIKPLDGSMVCRAYLSTGKYKEGQNIIIPDTALEEVFFAQVFKVGKGRVIDVIHDDDEAVVLRKPVPFAEGEDIVFARYHGERVKIGEDMFIVMRHDDAIATVELSKDGWFRFASDKDYDFMKQLDGIRTPGE